MKRKPMNANEGVWAQVVVDARTLETGSSPIPIGDRMEQI
jgi:hypothetical protein